MRFPDTFPAVFPRGGDVAAAKLALADYLKSADLDSLPSDEEFFAALERHALAAALATQSDAEMVRNLREDFGAAGLAALVAQLPPRRGALLFALTPAEAQHELVRLLPEARLAPLCQALLASDRMDDSESNWLFTAIRAARGEGEMPVAPEPELVTDRGVQVPAAATLSVLLPRVPEAARRSATQSALQRFHGTPPAWYRDILLPDMLDALPAEARSDLLLGIDVEALAAWRSLLPDADREAVDASMPTSLQASVEAASRFPTTTIQVSRATAGREALVEGLHEQLGRAGIPFTQAFAPDTDT